MHWFEKSKFGMFIHWGVYAGAFGNEWVKSDLKMTDEQYQKYVDQFEADRFDRRPRSAPECVMLFSRRNTMTASACSIRHSPITVPCIITDEIISVR